MFKVEMISDSVNPEDIRLCTVRARYPRIVHAELMTHRVFSRNSSSSRAIPFKNLASVSLEDPFIPKFRYNQKGMQPGDFLPEDSQREAEKIWIDTAKYNAEQMARLSALGVAKQWVNRPLEWFSYITVLITSTEWDNFFELRCHHQAQDEIRHLADIIRSTLNSSSPTTLKPGEWHLPFVTEEEHMGTVNIKADDALIKRSVARCARTSYETRDKKDFNPKEDEDLFFRLLLNNPIHASPAEHQATPDDFFDKKYQYPHLSGNLRSGWIQFRKLVEASKSEI